MSDWRKATSSINNGACLEAASWRKASQSNSQGACVEAGHGTGVVGVRDTKQAGSPDRTVLEFPASAWRAFTRDLKERRVTLSS